MSDSDSDENVIRYGTPLEPYEEDEVPSKRKYQEPADQYAVDSNGRRRFHGAFTGGFSAGFGNTVGSQEGWTPQHFKSSRLEKASVSTSSEFTGQKRQRPRGFQDGPIPGEPVLGHLLRAVHETAAVRMLRSMGWRAGQGTGDRLPRREKRRAADRHKVYGCYMPPELRPKEVSENEDSSDSEIDYETLFAPDDYEPYILSQKSDRFGLGYKGLSRHSVLGNLTAEYGTTDKTSRLSDRFGLGYKGLSRHSVLGNLTAEYATTDKTSRLVSIRGQAFGVGAFEADDEDIYGAEDMSHYDFALGPAKDTTKLKPIKSEASNVSLGRHELTAEARGQLLGESPLPKETDTQTNTQNAPSKRDELLAKILGRNLDFVSTESKTTEIIDMTKSTTEVIDMTSKKELNPADYISIKDSGKELTNVFKPFVTNPKKQARYEMYCEKGVLERDGDMDNLKDIKVGSATAEQAAAAARGVYGVMTRAHAAWRPDTVVCKRFNIPEPNEDERPKVSYSVFSYMESSVHDKSSFTKEQGTFSGSKSHRHHTDTDPKTGTTGQNPQSTNQVPETTKHTAQPMPVEKISEQTNPYKRITVAELFMKESEDSKKQGKEVTETIEKFDKIDLYKSIFLSDSEDETEDPKTVENTQEKLDFVEVPKNLVRNNSPPRVKLQPSVTACFLEDNNIKVQTLRYGGRNTHIPV
ncbi:G patch domain containing 1 [Operophtera brumata]|uniref:G patch domain containing 1 n=1 Tax=Operophtera brumata TaxID=104452 RepID=A0A0L7LAX8_OPEBR|nr:G patch domain containing 1 [Operophtera brumata]